MARTEHASPPAGTGHAPGLGEAFSINLSTGQGTYTYQLPMPAGVAGLAPRLVLEYVHGAGHGPWGLGWRMPFDGITRRLDFGVPDGTAPERFLHGGTEIVPTPGGAFAALRETAFTRYSRSGDGWLVEERGGMRHEIGLDAAHRAAPPEHPERPVEWLLQRTLDPSDNAIEYDWLTDEGTPYPATIRYAAYEVRFEYEARPDVRRDGRAGYLRRRALRCRRIRLVLEPGPGERTIRTYEFGYRQAPGSGVSLLAEIRLTAVGAAPDGSEDVHRPTVTFRYSAFDASRFVARLMTSEDGPPPGILDEDAAIVTLDAAPLPGVLVNRDGRQYYWPNRGGSAWGPGRPLGQAPFAQSFRREGLAFVDMDGSGTADLMVADPDRLQGYYENGGSDGWAGFVAFPRGQRSTPTWGDSNLGLADVDGDGLVDALSSRRRGIVWWRNRGRDGWSAPVLAPKDDEDLVGVDLSDPDVHLADMSGDGLLDIVRIRSGAVEVWPALGSGRYGARELMANSPRLRRDLARDDLLLVDLDGDGCADLVHVTPGGITVHQNQGGMRFADPVTLGPVPAAVPGTVRALNLSGRAGAGLAWNTMARGREAYVHLESVDAEPPYLLTGIDNGAGLVSTIAYRSAIDDFVRDRDAGSRWSSNFPFPYLVVASTHETDAVSGREIRVELRYHEAHFERHTRQFQGFARTERIERGDDSRPDTRLVHEFLMAQERVAGNGPEHAALNGLLARLETYQLDGTPAEGRPYRVETTDHDLVVLDRLPDGRARCFVAATVHRQQDLERGGDVRVEEHAYTYDAIGNVVLDVLRGTGTRDGVVQPGRERRTGVEYASGPRHILDRPARIVTRGHDGTLLSEKRFHYDGADFTGLPLGQLDRGLLARETEWVLTEAEFAAHYAGMDGDALGYTSEPNADGVPSRFAAARREAHDARGLLVASLDPAGNETRYTHDADGLFRVGMTDALGATAFAVDRAAGQITQVTYADGRETRFSYDAQGRVLRSALPGQDLAAAATVYTYDETVVPNRRVAVFRQPGGASSVGITYFDGYGKEFQQRVEVEPGRFLVSGLKLVNPWGDLRAEYEPTFAPDAAFAIPDVAGRPARRLFYDACGRVVRTENYNGGVSTAAYEPFRVVLRDASDNDDTPGNVASGQFDTPREEEFDVLRLLVRVTEHTGGNGRVVTGYEVGPLGELASVSDAAGVKARYRYDRRGNRIVIEQRESGTRTIWYDARRKPVRTLDGAGHDVRATWDAAGRQESLASGAGTLEAYTYDVPGRHALGRLAEVTYAGGSQAFTYDPSGHLVERAWRFDGVAAPRRLRYEYDELGRESAIVHEDGTRFERALTFNGWLRSIPGVIEAIDYEPRGYPLRVRYANGVETTYTYTAGAGRVATQVTTGPGNAILEQAQFRYDLVDRLVSRNDLAPGGSGLRTFEYDPLSQLTGVTTAGVNANVRLGYEYAADYNLRRSDEARSTFHYDDPARPDRLNGLTPDGAGRFDVDYDGNGNLLSLPGQRFAYNAKNELVRFEASSGETAEYRYDHLGTRVSKTVTDPQGSASLVLYTGDQAETRDGVTACFVTVGALRVAVSLGGGLRFLHDDGTGSTGFITDAQGGRLGSVGRQPFGTVDTTTGDVSFRLASFRPVDEETGLVYMRRRYYSPLLGRFLTPDLMATFQPERFLHAPQALHLYAFVANDPLNKADETGLSFWSFVGSVVGVIVGVIAAVAIVAAVVATGGLAGVLLGIGLALAASLAVTGIAYVVASNVDPGSGFGEFMRGFMIGFNAGMNGVLAAAVFGPFVGVAIGVINFLATFDTVAQSPIYQGILGWSSWLMPMSWGATGLGLVFYVVNLVVAGVTFQQWDAAKIDKLSIDWRTGSIVMVGGLIRNPTAFDMGNFVFMNPKYVDGSSPDRTYDAVLAHETGHTLAVAAFGTAFGIADLIGENLTGAGASDYGEQIAESHANRPGRPTIPMWG